MIIHLGPIVHKLCTEHYQTEAWSSLLSLEIFAAVEKCGADSDPRSEGADNKTFCLYMGYFSCFCCRLLTLKIEFKQASFGNAINQSVKRFRSRSGPTAPVDVLGLDLGPNYLQRLSAGDGLIIHAPK